MKVFYLLAARPGTNAAYTRSNPIIEKLQAETLDKAEIEADERLQGNPSHWQAKLGPSTHVPQVQFSLNGDKGTLLRPEFLPIGQALVLQVVSERPSLDFHAKIKEWAAVEEARIKSELEADPDYQEFKRLKKKFDTEGGN